MYACKKLIPVFFLVAGLAAVGCGRNDANPGPTGPQGATADGPTDGGGKYVLGDEPAGAKSVIDVRKQAKDGDEIVLVGRIGGSGKPFTGRAAFTVVDLSLEPCDDDGCGNPWCSVDPKELKEAVTLVRFTDAEGKTLPTDARQLLGAQMCQTVVVKGHAKRDEDGRFTVVAKGIHLKPLPSKPQ
jgi:hypothetical protein